MLILGPRTLISKGGPSSALRQRPVPWQRSLYLLSLAWKLDSIRRLDHFHGFILHGLSCTQASVAIAQDIATMEPPPTPAKAPSSTQLFQVFLRLRPPHTVLPSAAPTSLYPQLPGAAERFLTVEPPSPTTPSAPSEESAGARPTHITIRPPRDSRKRAVEKFGFTEVFEEPTSQLEVFSSVGVEKLVAGVLHEGRDALLATLGVTGSGKARTASAQVSSRALLIFWAGAEPHHSRVQVATRPHSALARPAVPRPARPPAAARLTSRPVQLACRTGCLRGARLRRTGIPRECVWRRNAFARCDSSYCRPQCVLYCRLNQSASLKCVSKRRTLGSVGLARPTG